MSVVSAELGVGAVKGRVSRGLGLLDTASVIVSMSFGGRIVRYVGVPVPVRLARLVVLGRVL